MDGENFVIGFVIGLILLGIAWLIFSPDPVATRHVLELKCGVGGALSSNNRNCKGTPYPSTDFKIQINTQTQKVLFVAYDLVGTQVYDVLHKNCDVIDGDNWDCNEGSEKYAMRDGHYYYTYSAKNGATGGDIVAPSSGFTGLAYWFYRWGIFSFENALISETGLVPSRKQGN